jgi:glutamate synthase domain-containing protein 3
MLIQLHLQVQLEGDANDYVGKCLSGGKIVIFPPKKARYPSEDNSIIGNVAVNYCTQQAKQLKDNWI